MARLVPEGDRIALVTPEEIAPPALFSVTMRDMIDQMVLHRGLTSDEKSMEKLADDVRTRGVKEGTFEEPTAHGTSALYMSSNEKGQSRLLVSIPLKSVGPKAKKTATQQP